MDYINSIDDDFMRQIIYLRNVCLMQWNEIAGTVGGNTENSVKKAYSRFVNKNLK